MTIADYASQAVIIAELRRHFPDDRIVGEEDASELRADKSLRSKVTKLARKALPDITPRQV